MMKRDVIWHKEAERREKNCGKTEVINYGSGKICNSRRTGDSINCFFAGMPLTLPMVRKSGIPEHRTKADVL